MNSIRTPKIKLAFCDLNAPFSKEGANLRIALLRLAKKGYRRERRTTAKVTDLEIHIIYNNTNYNM